MLRILGDVVTASPGAAQVFFLIAIITGAIATVVALLRNPDIWPALLAGTLTFIAAGLLFFA